MEAVDRAVRKLDRVLNYKDSYVLYAKGVEALEFDLMTGLRTVEAYPLTVSEYMEQQKPAPAVTPESLMDKTENGYGYEVLLMREGDITATEARALAMVWAEISADPSKEEQQIRFLEALYGDGTDRDKSPWIESYLLDSGNEEAYYTLLRMDNICLEEGCIERYKITADVRDGKTVYEIQGIMDTSIKELTVMNLTEEFAPFTEGERSCLVGPWKLDEWIHHIGSDEDYRFTYGLISENYQEAFGATYEEINPIMLSYLLDYEEELFRDGTRASKEEFLNGMLYYHGTLCDYSGDGAVAESHYNGDKYMYFLMSNSALKVERYVANEVEFLPGSREWEDLTKLTLYMSLYTTHDKYAGLENEEGYLHISNLCTNEETGMYTLDFNVIPRENILQLGEERIKAVEAAGSVNTATYEYGKIEVPWEPGYLERSLEQVILGTYSEDVTLLGTVGEILFGFTPFDIVQDFRDMTYYIKRIRCGDISFENIMMTAVSFLCIFGIGELFANSKYLKYLDDVNVDVSDVRNLAKVTEATEECLENSPKTISNILEQAEVVKYADDVEDMGSVIVLTNKGDDVVTTTVKKTDTVEEAGDAITNANKLVDGGGSDLPTAFRQTEFASSYDARLNQTPSLANRKVQFVGNRGESLCILKPPPDPDIERILNGAGVEGILYRNAIPDFSPVSRAEVQIDYMLGGNGVNGNRARDLNFQQASSKLVENLNESPELSKLFGMEAGNIKVSDVEKYRIANDLTWHELNDGRTLQLVPSEINSCFGHLGGVGEINAGMFVK